MTSHNRIDSSICGHHKAVRNLAACFLCLIVIQKNPFDPSYSYPWGFAWIDAKWHVSRLAQYEILNAGERHVNRGDTYKRRCTFQDLAEDQDIVYGFEEKLEKESRLESADIVRNTLVYKPLDHTRLNSSLVISC